ncbi:MAG: hypothetical protein ACKVOB_03520 [Sphingomonas sp.]
MKIVTLAMLSLAPQTAPTPLPTSIESPLAGDWTVDLTPKPGDPAYTKPMHLTLLSDGSVTGQFYQSDIEAGRWKTARGRTCVSFRTSDGQGAYHTAACLVGDQVEGQTWAEARSFLFPWNAVRSDPSTPPIVP